MLSLEQIERIVYHYAMSNSISYTAREAQVNRTSVRKYVKENLDEIDRLRREKKIEVVDALHAVQLRLVQELFDEDKIRVATLVDVAKTMGIVTDKLQLISGKATSRTESTTYDINRLSDEEKNSLAELRDKMLVDGEDDGE